MHAKDTKKRQRAPQKKTTRQKTDAQIWHKRLSQDIASILNNPETPRGLYNAISDELTEWQDARDNDPKRGWFTAPHIADCLSAYIDSEAKRRRGER